MSLAAQCLLEGLTTSERDSSAKGAILLPWETEPYRLWSLWDMFRFANAELLRSITNYENAIGQFLVTGAMGQPRDNALTLMASEVDALLSVTKPMALPVSWLAQASRLKDRIEVVRGFGPIGVGGAEESSIIGMAWDLKKGLVLELTQHAFFFVPASRKALYDKPGDWFGAVVMKNYPQAARDMRDACQCCALAQWTAAVFHSMRVLEHGLHTMAGELSVPSHGIQLEQWKNIIDQIESRIREQEQLPKSIEKSERLKFLAGAAAQFWYFKEAWRNHVSHSRTDYDEQGATQVLNHVKDFMQALADKAASQAGGGPKE